MAENERGKRVEELRQELQDQAYWAKAVSNKAQGWMQDLLEVVEDHHARFAKIRGFEGNVRNRLKGIEEDFTGRFDKLAEDMYRMHRLARHMEEHCCPKALTEDQVKELQKLGDELYKKEEASRVNSDDDAAASVPVFSDNRVAQIAGEVWIESEGDASQVRQSDPVIFIETSSDDDDLTQA